MKPLFYIILFIVAQVFLENIWVLVPDENYFHLHTAITAGILDNILPALVIFYLCRKHEEPWIVVVAMVWLAVEILDGLIRLALQYMIYDPDISAFNANKVLTPAAWLYVLIPLIWLMIIRRNFTLKPSDPFDSGTFLYFRRPQTISDYLVSFFGGCTSTVFPVVEGYYYHFHKGQPLAKERFKKSMLNEGRLVRIKPPKGFKAFLESRIGVRYNLISRNCVTVMRGSGLKIGILDFIPSVFMLRYKARQNRHI